MVEPQAPAKPRVKVTVDDADEAKGIVYLRLEFDDGRVVVVPAEAAKLAGKGRQAYLAGLLTQAYKATPKPKELAPKDLRKYKDVEGEYEVG